MMVHFGQWEITGRGDLGTEQTPIDLRPLK